MLVDNSIDDLKWRWFTVVVESCRPSGKWSGNGGTEGTVTSSCERLMIEICLQEEDIEGDFDPDEHDRRMKALFDEQFYGEADDEKPVFPDLDEELEIGTFLISLRKC